MSMLNILQQCITLRKGKLQQNTVENEHSKRCNKARQIATQAKQCDAVATLGYSPQIPAK
jgi:hypothetical protein